MKKPVVLFTIADNKNLPLAKMFVNSVRKFHTEAELPIVIIGEEEIKEYKDPDFFYRATPTVAKQLFKEYEYVIKADCDQICLGDLNHIIKNRLAFDVGTVLNINRVDPPVYGFVTCCNILPQEYYNCGLVAMKSEAFVDHWLRLCYEKYFQSFQYREQDLLNIMCHFGDYVVRCFDKYDGMTPYQTWNGLIAKGEGVHMELREGAIVLPKGKDGYPNRDVVVKLYHMAGGSANENKMNYRLHFDEKLIDYISYLVSEENAKSV